MTRVNPGETSLATRVPLRRVAMLVVATLIALPVAAAADVTIAPAPKATLVELKIPSPEKDFPMRDVYVWTPAVAASQIPELPVVYMLHGWPGTPNGIMGAMIAPAFSLSSC